MSDFDLTRDEFQRLAERARGDTGLLAETVMAAHYDVDHDPDEAEWYDLRNEDTGTKVEVKSTHATIDGRNPDRYVPTEGRFRSSVGSRTRSSPAAIRG